MIIYKTLHILASDPEIANQLAAALSGNPADAQTFTDEGAGLLGAEVRAQLDEGVRVSLFAADPKPTVIVPTVASVSSVNRAARALPGVTFTARLAGAIHSTDMTGVASA